MLKAFKPPTHLDDEILQWFIDDPNLTPREALMKKLTTGKTPPGENTMYTNTMRIEQLKERALVLKRDDYEDAHRLLKRWLKDEAYWLPDDMTNYLRSVKTNTPERPVFASDGMLKIAAKGKVLEVDITFWDHTFMKYLLNIVVFDEEMTKWWTTFRMATSKQDAGFYHEAFLKFLDLTKETDPNFNPLQWLTVVMDFSQAQLKGLKSAQKEYLKKQNIELSDDEFEAFVVRVFQGCLLHFLRCVEEWSNKIDSEIASAMFKERCRAIPSMSKEARAEMWDWLTKHYKALEGFIKFWRAPEVDALLCHLHQGKTFADWVASTRDSNAVESSHRPVKAKGKSLVDKYRIVTETDALVGLQRQNVERYSDTVADRFWVLRTRQKAPAKERQPRGDRYVNDGKPKKGTKRKGTSAEAKPRSKKVRFNEEPAELHEYSQPSQTQNTPGTQSTTDVIPSEDDDMALTQNPCGAAETRQVTLKHVKDSPPALNSIMATYTTDKSKVWFAFAREEMKSGWKVDWVEKIEGLDVHYRVDKLARDKRDKVEMECIAVTQVPFSCECGFRNVTVQTCQCRVVQITKDHLKSCISLAKKHNKK